MRTVALVAVEMDGESDSVGIGLARGDDLRAIVGHREGLACRYRVVELGLDSFQFLGGRS